MFVLIFFFHLRVYLLPFLSYLVQPLVLQEPLAPDLVHIIQDSFMTAIVLENAYVGSRLLYLFNTLIYIKLSKKN